MSKVALTIGTFEILHAGHIKLFKRCDEISGREDNVSARVIVGVNSDNFVEKYKGYKPIFDQAERSWFIKELGYETVVNYGAGDVLIKKIVPDYLVIGDDWLKKDYLAQINMTPQELHDLGITLVYTPYTDGISTTTIKERLNG